MKTIKNSLEGIFKSNCYVGLFIDSLVIDDDFMESWTH